MKVITTNTSGGIDKDAVSKNEDGSYELPSTITVLANTQQAKLLAEYEGNAEIHAALVYRGDKTTAEKFLSTQNSYFKNKTETTTEGGAVNE
jgi:pilus assembly protein CpaB